MPVRIKSIGGIFPGALPDYLAYGIYIPASPIYTSISIRAVWTGSRTVSSGITITENYYGDLTETFTRVEPTSYYDDGLVIAGRPYLSVLSAPATSKAYFNVGYYDLGIGSLTAHFDPKKQGISPVFGARSIPVSTVGTRTIIPSSGPSTYEDILDSVSYATISADYPVGESPLDDPMYEGNRMSKRYLIVGNERLDITDYSAEQWRDLRGNYYISWVDDNPGGYWDSTSYRVDYTVTIG